MYRPLVHELSMPLRAIWVLGVYSLAAYARGVVMLLNQSGGPGKEFSERMPANLMLTLPMLAMFGINSLYRGSYNQIMIQSFLSAVYASAAIHKLVDQEFRPFIGFFLQSSEWVHTLVFVLDGIVFATYPLTHTVSNSRIRRLWHGFYMYIVVIYNGLLEALVWEPDRLFTLNMVSIVHNLMVTLCHICLHPHYSDE